MHVQTAQGKNGSTGNNKVRVYDNLKLTPFNVRLITTKMAQIKRGKLESVYRLLVVVLFSLYYDSQLPVFAKHDLTRVTLSDNSSIGESIAN